jgi:hypothetical protein
VVVIFIEMKKNPNTELKVKRFVNDLPSETNYLLKYNYIIPSLSEEKLTELTERHQKNKVGGYISGRITEFPKFEEDWYEVTFFEILDNSTEETNLIYFPEAKVSVQYLYKRELLTDLLPIESGMEKSPFVVFH